MVKPIVKLYASLVLKGEKTIEQVPASIREDVKNYLEQMEQSFV